MVREFVFFAGQRTFFSGRGHHAAYVSYVTNLGYYTCRKIIAVKLVFVGVFLGKINNQFGGNPHGYMPKFISGIPYDTLPG